MTATTTYKNKGLATAAKNRLNKASDLEYTVTGDKETGFKVVPVITTLPSRKEKGVKTPVSVDFKLVRETAKYLVVLLFGKAEYVEKASTETYKVDEGAGLVFLTVTPKYAKYKFPSLFPELV